MISDPKKKILGTGHKKYNFKLLRRHLGMWVNFKSFLLTNVEDKIYRCLTGDVGDGSISKIQF